ncbi:trypsin-like cysteine/serine peptidase domain-containing protein [Aspergillus egyptiacus]|nr:trypsin-like cysteine/serine peptidase domain-containing protein [Aspergillus egyptiacus]
MIKPLALVFLLQLAARTQAQLPLSSSYADKCLFTGSGHRYDGKEAPISPNHKSTITCGAYPTEADFMPVPDAQNADECALTCTGDCEGTTWSEVAGTEYKCHTFRDRVGGVDKTAAAIMIMSPPLPASAQEQRDWICPQGSDPNDPPSEKYHPPNLKLTYRCNTAPQTTASVYYVEAAAKDPVSCVLACKDRKDTHGECAGSMWYPGISPSCYTIGGDDGGTKHSPGNLYIHMGWSQYLLAIAGALSTLSPVSAIYLGAPSNCGEHPYAVQIEHSGEHGGEAFLCGGTLITARHILTANHCVVQNGHVYPATVAHTSDLKVRLLKCTNDGQLDRQSGRVYDTVRIHSNPRHTELGFQDSDIAVIELAKEVKYHPFLSAPAALPASEGPVKPEWEGCTRLTMIGAGTIGKSQSVISDVLRQTRGDVLTKSECLQRSDAALGAPFSSAHNRHSDYFCALDRVTLSGACGGDSGSGAHEYVGGRKRVVGVVSAGPIICAQPNHVNAYTSVTAYLKWIREFIGSGYELKVV